MARGGLDFLHPSYPYKNIDSIIMNPPFSKIIPFVQKSLKLAKKKVVLFAQLQFLESQSRYNQIFSRNKPNRIYIYVDRVACAKDGDFKNAHESSMTYAWFVWDKINTKNKFQWIRRWDKREKPNLFKQSIKEA